MRTMILDRTRSGFSRKLLLIHAVASGVLMRQSVGNWVVRAILAALIATPIPVEAQDSSGDIRPAPYQIAWQDLEFGVILHFSTNTFLNQEWGDGTASPSVFNPTQFDPEQWM